jgi:uncharacterized membrane protein YgdD (TMEM256/DUF423 family)
MMQFAALGAVNAFLAVGAGAFGAHGLRGKLPEHFLDIFEVAVRYQMFHALGLFAVAWMVSREVPHAALAGWLMTGGILVFSGSLYALAITRVSVLGAITPFGGLALLASWALLAYGAVRSLR